MKQSARKPKKNAKQKSLKRRGLKRSAYARNSSRPRRNDGNPKSAKLPS
jgi:hypothetical protein